MGEVNKKKIKLVISDTAPLFPPVWGGPKRIWNIYANFTPLLFDITYAGVNWNVKPQSGQANYIYNIIKHNFKEILRPLPLHYYKWKPIERKIFKDLPLDLFTYLAMQTDCWFRDIFLKHPADILVCSHPWSWLSMRRGHRKLLVYDAHNCEYFLMKQILEGQPFRGLISGVVKYIEGDLCRKSDLVLVCSDKEKEDFMDIYNVATDKIIMVPNGTTIRDIPNPGQKNMSKEKLGLKGCNTVLFVGTHYKPNIEAANFIVDTLAISLPSFTFLIAGGVYEAFPGRVLPANVRFTGKLSEEELDVIFKASDIAINPMFKGAGVNIKMLDYFSAGLPVITTPVGARGINGKNFVDMIICEKKDFSASIKRLFNDTRLRDVLTNNAFKLASDNFDWQKISRNLESILLKYLGRGLAA